MLYDNRVFVDVIKLKIFWWESILVYTGGSLIITYEEQEEFSYEEQEYASQRRCNDMMVKAYDRDQSSPRP